MKKILTSAWLSAAALVSSVIPVWAAGEINLKPEAGSKWGPLGELTIPALVAGLIKLVLVVAALVFFFMLVIGGIQWIVSGGDKAATEGARNRITAALIGLVVVFAAWAIVQLINTFFGIDIFRLAIPTL